MRTSDDCIDGDKSSEFVMKCGITMNFWIFYLLDPVDVELISDGEETFLRFFQIGKVTSYEFSKKFSSNWITNADGPDPFSATHFLMDWQFIHKFLWNDGRGLFPS